METFLNSVAAQASGAMVAAIWQGAVLAGCVALCLRLMPPIGAAARSVIWLAVLLLMIALPFVAPTGGSALAGSRESAGLHLAPAFGLALAFLWGAVALLRTGQLMRSAWHLRGLARAAQPISASPEIAGLLLSPHRGAVQLCASSAVDRPSVVGFLRPRILVPSALLAQLTDDELQQIVLHEMEHLRRGDDWTNLLQKLALAAFPLLPALYFVERRLCLERELACDDRVLRATGARKAYAACLASLAEHTLVRRGVSLALGAWERQSEVVRRVERILFGDERELPPRRLVPVLGSVLVVLIASAGGLAHAPQLVSFAAPVPLTLEAGGAQPEGFPMANVGRATLTEAVLKIHSTSPAGGALLPERNRRREHAIPRAAGSERSSVTSRGLQRAEFVRSVDAADRSRSELMMLVSWRVDYTTSGEPILSEEVRTVPVAAVEVRARSLPIRYTAVSVRNGWLVVQL